MHCPGCGQQQVSNETKFCSRCGLPLGVVAEVLAQGGYLPQLDAINKKGTVFTRRNGIAFSVLWCLFFLLVMAPLWGIMNVDKLAGASAVIGIFGGLILFISSLFFLKKPFVSYADSPYVRGPAELYGNRQQNALPPQQSIPVSQYAPSAGSWRDTNDLQPASITESTTRLLSDDDQR